jgi:hypothetical protein
MKTPNQMHNQNEIKIRTYKSKNPQEARASCGFFDLLCLLKTCNGYLSIASDK